MIGKSRTYTILIIAMIAWGSVYPASKYLMAEISPFFAAFLRYGIGIIALTPFFLVEIQKNNNHPDSKSILVFLIAGICGVAVFAYFLFTGVSLSTASNGSVIINTQPVFTAILAPLLVREHIGKIQIAGIITGFAGMFLVVTGGDIHSLLAGNNIIKGNVLLLAGAVSMSLYGIILKKPIIRYGSIIPTWYSMMFGTILLTVFNIATGSFSGFSVENFSMFDITLVIYLGTVGTAFAYLLFNLSLKSVDVIIATAFKFLIPVSGILLSVLFIGERPGISVYAGVIIVIFSVFLIQRKEVFFRSGK